MLRTSPASSVVRGSMERKGPDPAGGSRTLRQREGQEVGVDAGAIRLRQSVAPCK